MGLQTALLLIGLLLIGGIGFLSWDRYQRKKIYGPLGNRQSKGNLFTKRQPRSPVVEPVDDDQADDFDDDDLPPWRGKPSRIHEDLTPPPPSDPVPLARPDDDIPAADDWQPARPSMPMTHQPESPTTAFSEPEMPVGEVSNGQSLDWPDAALAHRGVHTHLCAHIGGGNGRFSVEALMPRIKQAEADIGRRVKIYARAEISQSFRRLVRVIPGGVSDIVLAVQLATRDGTLDERQITRVTSMGVEVADGANRLLKWSPHPDDALQEAVTLSQTASRFELIAMVYVLAEEGQTMNGHEIQRVCDEAGLELSSRGLFEYYGTGRQTITDREFPIFSVADRFQPGVFSRDELSRHNTSGLTLFMNLPTVADPSTGYEEMVRLGFSLCRKLGGRLVDQDQRPLNRSGLDRVANEIRSMADEMRSFGLAPGSEATRSLY